MRRLIYVLQLAARQLDYILKNAPQIEELTEWSKLQYTITFNNQKYKVTIDEV